MNSLDPATFTTKELVALDSYALHHLAVRSCGTLTAYRLLLGRCLLAIGETDLHFQHGCSSPVHYAIRVLGMPKKKARVLLYVARNLEALPKLSRQAAHGTIEWSKLREVVRVASPETEAHWIELCANHTYSQIERLVSLTPYGQLPGDPKETRNRAQLSELHCLLEAEAMQIVERGLQSMCQEAGKMLSMAEAIEYLFAEYLAKRPLDEAGLEKARQEARKDLQECPAREICPSKFPTNRLSDSTWPARQDNVDALRWTDTVEAHPEPCPDNSEIQLVKREPRLPGPKLRKQLLRRDGYCCTTPGCPNTLFLHTHHIVYYCQNGKTVPSNLVVLCSRCHRNVHTGRLKIQGRAPHRLQFLDAQGRDLSLQHKLDTAHWIDIWLGWTGGEFDTHYQLARISPEILTSR